MNNANESMEVDWLITVDDLKREIESLSLQTMAVLFIASKKHLELVISLCSYIHLQCIYTRKIQFYMKFPLSIF